MAKPIRTLVRPPCAIAQRSAEGHFSGALLEQG
jgi:hypothetical protein